VQDLPERVIVCETYVHQGLIETGNRPSVHFLVRPVAAVHPDDGALIPVQVRIPCGTAERFRPIGSESLGVLWMESVAEGVAHHFVDHHSGVPCSGQA
jgi:hypothetical protein